MRSSILAIIGRACQIEGPQAVIPMTCVEAAELAPISKSRRDRRRTNPRSIAFAFRRGHSDPTDVLQDDGIIPKDLDRRVCQSEPIGASASCKRKETTATGRRLLVDVDIARVILKQQTPLS